MSRIDLVIPTYGREVSSVERAIDSFVYNSHGIKDIGKIIIIDQNPVKLRLKYKNVLEVPGGKLNINIVDESIIHVYGVKPSLTSARNIGGNLSRAKIIYYIDDDAEILQGSIINVLKVFEDEKVAFVAGREIVSGVESEHKFNLIEKIKSMLRNFRLGDNKVALIDRRGFFYCDFSKRINGLVEVDTVRGCNFAIKKEWFDQVGGFDTNFTTNALREESDFILRVIKSGGRGFYTSDTSVIHYRQTGGCNNLAKNLKSLNDTFKNEQLFQTKHFIEVPALFFGIKLLPKALSFAISTNGKSLVVLFKHVIEFWKEKRRSK